MSLQDIGAGTTSTHTGRPLPGQHPARGSPRTGATPESRARNASQLTSLGHQSSLRSLLSNSYDSDEMKEEILRQIAEEGLLDDIDWDNIEDDQEEEISERIAEAYRRRRRDRHHRRPQTGNREGDRSSGVRQSGEHARRSEEHTRSSRPSSESVPGPGRGQTSRPPASRPHLLENTDSRPRIAHHRRRSSSQNRELRPPSSSETARRAARSATDLSENPTSRDHRHERQRRSSQGQRSSTDPDGLSISQQWRQAASAPHIDTTAASRTFESPQVVQSPEGPIPHTISVSCDRCGRANIEKDLHYSCGICKPEPATYDLCSRCYRKGEGCLHWFGFGHSAWPMYERKGRPGLGPPHNLQSRRYVASDSCPTDEAERRAFGLSPPSQDRGALVLQTGVFCDVCSSNANTSYWHCDICNSGEWGYCIGCVRAARHCTHPLLPLALAAGGLKPQDPPCSCNECQRAIAPLERRMHCPTCEDGDYDVHTRCYAALADAGRIPPGDGPNGRRKCPRGHRMQVVQFAEHAGGPRWRSVIEDVVGGWGVDDEDEARPTRQWSWREGDDGHRSSQSMPPDRSSSSSQQQALAIWPWIGSDEDARDELVFPKGAVVSDVTDINGDFLWGTYCRARGLFPANYVRML